MSKNIVLKHNVPAEHPYNNARVPNNRQGLLDGPESVSKSVRVADDDELDGLVSGNSGNGLNSDGLTSNARLHSLPTMEVEDGSLVDAGYDGHSEIEIDINRSSLTVGWLNIHSLPSKTVEVKNIIDERGLDAIVLRVVASLV